MPGSTGRSDHPSKRPAITWPRHVAAALAMLLIMATVPVALAASDQPPTPQALDQRAQVLDRKEQALRAMESDIDARLAKLTQIKTVVQAMLDEAKSVQDPRIQHLISVYANMKAQQAASDLEVMDQLVAVKILSGMKGRQAGEILSRMSTKGAEKLTAALSVLQVGKDLPKLH